MDLRELPQSAFRRHPWETARAAFFINVLERAGLAKEPVSVLDVGAGDGYFASVLYDALPPESWIACVDAHYDEAQLEQLRARAGGRTISFHTTAPSERFDVVVLLDVLEHVADDAAFLQGLIGPHLSPAGFVLASVPAWRSLFTRHDVALGHFRRYRPSELRSLLRDSDLRVVVAGGLFPSLLPVRAVAKVRERLAGVRAVPDVTAMPDHAATDAGQWSRGRRLTAAVAWCLGVDARVSLAAAWASLPIPALSTWALARADTQP